MTDPAVPVWTDLVIDKIQWSPTSPDVFFVGHSADNTRTFKFRVPLAGMMSMRPA